MSDTQKTNKSGNKLSVCYALYLKDEIPSKCSHCPVITVCMLIKLGSDSTLCCTSPEPLPASTSHPPLLASEVFLLARLNTEVIRRKTRPIARCKVSYQITVKVQNIWMNQGIYETVQARRPTKQKQIPQFLTRLFKSTFHIKHICYYCFNHVFNFAIFEPAHRGFSITSSIYSLVLSSSGESRNCISQQSCPKVFIRHRYKSSFRHCVVFSALCKFKIYDNATFRIQHKVCEF